MTLKNFLILTKFTLNLGMKLAVNLAEDGDSSYQVEAKFMVKLNAKNADLRAIIMKNISRSIVVCKNANGFP